MTVLRTLFPVLVALAAFFGASTRALAADCPLVPAASATPCGPGFLDGTNPYLFNNSPTGCVVRYPICLAASNVTLDCGGRTIDGTSVPDNGLHAGIRVADDVQWVNVKNCKVRNFKTGALVRGTEGDLSLLGYTYWNGGDTKTIEDGIRATQPRHIWFDHLDTAGVEIGLYVFGHVTDVNLSWSTISASVIGVYLDTGSQYNVIRDSTFTTSSATREAIAVDASAYNQIIRNTFEGDWSAGVELYKNCGEQWWRPMRPQPAMGNRIKYNNFVGIPVGVRIASRADKLSVNWNANETAFTSTRWKCADPIYALPANPGLGVPAASLTGLSYRGDYVYREAYYRDRAPDNVVRCNRFSGTGTAAVSVGDDHALVEGNQATNLIAGNILVGSTVRASKSEPVQGVHVMNNSQCTALGVGYTSCPAGTCITNAVGVNSQWGEPEGCNECFQGPSTCPTGFTGSTPVSRPSGWLDSVENGQACGWAVDLDQQNDPIDVKVYVDGALAASGTTNVFRADVNESVHVKGNHGFCLPLTLTPGPHSVVAFGVDRHGMGDGLLADNANGLHAGAFKWTEFPRGAGATEVAFTQFFGIDTGWKLGTTSSGGGYQVGRWSMQENAWYTDPGRGVKIAVDDYNMPWLVTTTGDVFARTTSGTWELKPGCAVDLGIGWGLLWVIGCGKLGEGGNGIYKWNGTGFDKTPTGSAVQIAVGNDGRPWVVSSSGLVYRRTTNSVSTGDWELISGTTASDIAVTYDNVAYVVGPNAFGWGKEILMLNEQPARVVNGRLIPSRRAWMKTGGGGVRVAGSRWPWVVTDRNTIHYGH